MQYLLITKYKDGMVSRFQFNSEELKEQISERMENNEEYDNVHSWTVLPAREREV